MADPWLSVIMPTYNGAAYLPAALASVACQADEGVQVVVVDDASDDATLEIVGRFAGSLRIEVVQRRHGGNWAASTNVGMALARGTHLCWLHQDDVWCAGRLSAVREFVERWPKAGLFLCPSWYMGATGRRIGYWHCPLPARRRALRSAEVIEPLLVQCFVASPAPVFRADVAAAAGGLDETLWYSADWDFWLKLAAMGYTVYDPRPLTKFRVHLASQTLARADLAGEMARQQSAVLERHLGRWEGKLAEGAGVARAARFSAALNLALARWIAGAPLDAGRLLGDFALLGPAGWFRYLRDSRILERGLSRWQAGAHRRRREQAVASSSIRAAGEMGAHARPLIPTMPP